MASLDDIWRSSLAEFGKGLGLPEQALPGSAMTAPGGAWNCLIGDNQHLLSLEFLDADHETLAMALFCQAPTAQGAKLGQQLMQRCHYEQYLPFLVQVGLAGEDQLALAIRLGRGDSGELLSAFELLYELYAKVGF